MKKKAGLLLVVFYFGMTFFFKTEISENILLRISDSEFWDKYLDLFFYIFFLVFLISQF